MKVLYFHQHFTTRTGSTGTRSYEMARALVASGHDVHIVCGSFQIANSGLTNSYVKGKRTGVVDGIRVTEFKIPYSNNQDFLTRTFAFLKFALLSVKIALTDSYDLVFATSTPLTAGIPGIIAKLFRRKPFVFEVRDLWPELPKEMGVITNPVVLFSMSVLEWISYRSADACIGLSPGIVKGIQKRSQKNKVVALIPNGCDIELFGNRKYSKNIRQKFTAIFTGAHGKANGLDAVLDTAAILKKRKKEHINFLFVGEGSEKERLISRSQNESLNNCKFIGVVPKTELVAIIHSADIGLMILDNIPAFYYGTSPNKFFDYIASGLPVLTNYPGWIADIISENSLGIAVPPSNPTVFADALIDISKNQEALEQMSENAQTCAETIFNRNILSMKFVDFLESVSNGDLASKTHG